jgi:hypothetical protein
MMKYQLLSLLLAAASLLAAPMMGNPQLSVQNQILTQVNGNTISVVDVMKKMDLALHQSYPQFADSPQARFQFYSQGWRPIFKEMVDTELILADAADKEIKIADGEVREEMESRFGPNILLTLDKIGLTYDDAWKMVKNEMIVRRMTWYFVHSRAIQSVSPEAIRRSYRDYLQENPPYQQWNYRVVTLRGADAKERASEIHRLLLERNESPETAALFLKEWEQEHAGCTILVSNEYSVKDSELSAAHHQALAVLEPGVYSEPAAQASRGESKPVYRIFYLSQRDDHPAPAFEDLALELKNRLIQQSIVKESDTYLQKLRNHYGYDPAHLRESVPDNLQPFHLE